MATTRRRGAPHRVALARPITFGTGGPRAAGADATVPVPGTGTLLIDADALVVGANNVLRPRDRIAGAGAAELVDVKDATPTSDLYGMVVLNHPDSAPLAVTGVFWQATQPVSGPLTDVQLRAAPVPVSGPLTDAQLRAVAVPVSGPFLTDAQLRAVAVPVSGAFFQATQPVSVAATLNVDVTDEDARLAGRVKILDSAGAVIDPALKGQLPAALVGGRLSVDIGASIAIPVTDNASSLTVDAPVGTPVFVRLSDGAAALIGQKVMASSLPVVIASDQGVLQVHGAVAHDAVDSGNPLKVGGIAKTALPAAVAVDDRVNFIADIYGRQIVLTARPKILGSYKAESGRLTILAAAHAATAGFFWLINPVASGVVCYVKRVMAMSVPTAVTAFPSSPRVTCERVTFTGTASGAQLTAAKRDSTDAANVCTLRTASTGLVLTGGAVATSFQVSPVLTGVGVAVPAEQYFYDTTDEDDYIVLRAGEGLVFRQADAGTAADTRIMVISLGWEER